MERATEVSGSPARPVDPPVNDYAGMAEAYAAETENSLVNAYYERPAMLDLAGDVVRPPRPGRRARLGPPVRVAAGPRSGRHRHRLLEVPRSQRRDM